MQYVTESITVFTDANVMLNHEALHEIAKHYNDENVGGVSGEKEYNLDLLILLQLLKDYIGNMNHLLKTKRHSLQV